MALFYCPEPVTLGTKRFFLANSESIEENRLWAKKLREYKVTSEEPPLSKTLQSRTLPRLLISESIGANCPGSQVPRLYLPVLNWLLKKDFYLNFSRDPKTQTGLKKLEIEIRAKLIQLIIYEELDEDAEPIPGTGVVNVETEDVRLQKLNAQLRKIDLGRRADLNFGVPLTDLNRAINMKYKQVIPRQNKAEDKLARSVSKKVAETGHLEETPFERAKRLGRVPID